MQSFTILFIAFGLKKNWTRSRSAGDLKGHEAHGTLLLGTQIYKTFFM